MSEVAPVDPDREYFFDASGKQSRRILRGAEAKETFESIPVINVSRVNSPDLEVRKSLATEINRAATDVGFFILENPPVDFQKMGIYLSISIHHVANAFDRQRVRYY